MTATRRFQRVISADAHVMEPLDLWWKALGGRFGDKPPRPLHEYQRRQGTFFSTGYQG
jgi:hypothetical protein